MRTTTRSGESIIDAAIDAGTRCAVHPDVSEGYLVELVEQFVQRNVHRARDATVEVFVAWRTSSTVRSSLPECSASSAKSATR